MESHNVITPINRILIPLDGSFLSEQALPYAKSIGGPETDLILFGVAAPGEPIRGFTGRIAISADEVTRAHVKRTENLLDEARQAWLGTRSHVRNETAVGDPTEQILGAADREHVDLIVMASHGHGAIGRWVMGSVADRVVRTSSIPVMVMRPRDENARVTATSDIRRIVVPFDGSDLAASAFPFVKRLALSLQVPVLLIKVTEITRSLESGLFYGMALSPELFDEILREAQANDQAELSAAADQLLRAGVEVQELVVDGVVADAIVSLTEPTDVIVMTSHGRGGLRRIVLGSIAEKLVRQGPVPVILPRQSASNLQRTYQHGV